MDIYTAKLPINPSFVSGFKQMDDAIVLSNICELSAQLHTFCYLFNIPHVASRLGWIVDPTPKLGIVSKLDTKRISASIKRLVKEKLLDWQKDPLAVRPNVGEIERRFTTGYVTQAIEIADVSEWDSLSNQEYWAAIPGVSDGKPKITLEDYVKKVQSEFEWAKQYSVLNNAPERIIVVSQKISQITGFIPDTKDWIASVSALLAIAGDDTDTLEEGLLKGNVARSTGVTLASLRSYSGFVRDVAASKRVVVGVSQQTQSVIRI